MGKWTESPDWETSIYLVDTYTPLIGGTPEWAGTDPQAGFANISAAQLANRTAYLRQELGQVNYRIDNLLLTSGNTMVGENNLSELTDINQAKYRLGLNLVDNTRDLLKPISEATQLALDNKEDKDALKSAAYKDVGTDEGEVMPVGAFGLGSNVEADPDGIATVTKTAFKGWELDENLEDAGWLYGFEVFRSPQCAVQFGLRDKVAGFRTKLGGNVNDWVALFHKHNLKTGLGDSDEYPISQNAVKTAVESKQDKLNEDSLAMINKGSSTSTFLRNDGTWVTPSNTTYSAMTTAAMWTGTSTTSSSMTAKNIRDYSDFTTLSGSTVTPNMNTGRNFYLSADDDIAFNNPTNMKSGQTGDIVIKSTGSERVLSFQSNYKFAGGKIPSVKENSMTVISYKVVSGNEIVCGFIEDVK